MSQTQIDPLKNKDKIPAANEEDPLIEKQISEPDEGKKSKPTNMFIESLQYAPISIPGEIIFKYNNELKEYEDTYFKYNIDDDRVSEDEIRKLLLDIKTIKHYDIEGIIHNKCNNCLVNIVTIFVAIKVILIIVSFSTAIYYKHFVSAIMIILFGICLICIPLFLKRYCLKARMRAGLKKRSAEITVVLEKWNDDYFRALGYWWGTGGELAAWLKLIKLKDLNEKKEEKGGKSDVEGRELAVGDVENN